MAVVGSCARCATPVALHAARPVVGDDGKVGLLCAPCQTGAPRRRPRPVTAIELEAVSAPPPDPRSSRRRLGAAVGVAVAAVALVGSIAIVSPAGSVVEPRAAAAGRAVAQVAHERGAGAATESGTVTGAEPESGAESESGSEPESGAEPESGPGSDTDPAAAEAAAELARLDEERPSLRDWVHPVSGSDELTPVRGTRKFGAHRAGVSDPARCGRGHCGVDLAGPRGRPVVAVAWGTVVRVEHSRDGRDGRSGRYVRVEHPEGVFTSYMHLDAISAELAVGDEVQPGQVLGTLGKSGIRSGEQHLHFALELRERDGLVFVDPTPYLARAEVVPVPQLADDELRLAPEDRSSW